MMILHSINDKLRISYPSYLDVRQYEANKGGLYKDIYIYIGLEPDQKKLKNCGTFY